MAEIDKEKLRRAIVNRGMVVPVVEYDDGSQGWGVPGLIMEPIEAWQRLQAGASDNVARMQQGLPFDPQAAGDAFAVTGAAAMGSVAAPKPAGAYVTSGAPMQKAQQGIRAYHGTATQEAIDKFKPGMKGDSPHMEHDTPAVFFTGSPNLADEYARSTGRELADRLAHEWRAAGKSEDEIARLYNNESHTELNAAHKMFMDRAKATLPPNIARVLGPAIERGQIDLQSIAQEFGDDVARIMAENMALAREVGNYYPDHSAVYPVDIGGNLREVNAGAFGNNFHPVIYDNLLKESKAQGYDGLALRNVADSPFGSDQPHDVFAMFNPGHVRSATTGELLYANPKEAAALGAAVQGERQGIRAYHGSPHDFDKFDISKMGTGEGAQAYGPGLYFAEKQEVARQYEGMLAGNGYDPAVIARDALIASDGDPRKALSILARDTPPKMGLAEFDILADNYALASQIMRDHADGKPMPLPERGRMYEVNINADPNDFLDWDAPWASQPAAVQRAMREAGVHPERSGPFGTKEIPDTPISISVERALKDPQHMIHETLKEQSVPGIKYLDGNSRTAGQGSRNYVVFDDSLIEIVKKYGIAGAASMYGVSELELMEAMQEQGL